MSDPVSYSPENGANMAQARGALGGRPALPLAQRLKQAAEHVPAAAVSGFFATASSTADLLSGNIGKVASKPLSLAVTGAGLLQLPQANKQILRAIPAVAKLVATMLRIG